MKQNEITGKFEREYKINDTFFNSLDSEEKAYILGFLYADGCNFLSKNGQKVIKLVQLEQDKDILEQISQKMESTYPLHKIVQNTNGKIKYEIYITSSKLSDALYNLGMVYNKSLILTFPKKYP